MANDTIRVLGIDPGSRKAGWGLVDVEPQRRTLVHVDNGVFMLDAKAPLPDRLVDLSRRLHGVIEKYRPHRAAVEDVYVDKGVRSALTLGQARGAVVATIGLCGIVVETHTATQVKQRVTGKGRASKTQVNEMVCHILGLNEAPYEDAADALAVSICQALESLAPSALSAALAAQGQATSGSSAQPKSASRRKGRDALADLARAQGKLPAPHR